MDHVSCDPTAIDRRSYLKGAAALSLTSSAGCIRQTANLVDRASPKRVSLSIKTTPADDDPYAMRIAQRLATHLEAVGVAVQVIPMRIDELLRGLLINQDFDLYVTNHPGGRDPDYLYSLLHSRFNAEPGWQNPFGFSDLTIDDLLTGQRGRIGSRRRRVVFELQRALARTQPFTVIAIPDVITAVREDEYGGWTTRGLATPLDYLALRESAQGETNTTHTPSSDRSNALRVTSLDRWMTRNLNPLAVEFRSRGTITGLLYDSLLRRYGDEFLPWLAESWSWDASKPGDRSTATVRLRDGVRWHDRRPITSEDVAFTFRFLSDTSNDADTTVPAPRFRGHVSLIDSIETAGDRGVRVEFDTASRAIAARALTVPILPRHEWKPRGDPATVAGIDSGGETTQVLVWNNMDPVGSGPLRFERAIIDETLILDRFDDHFLHRETTVDVPESIADGVAFDRIVFRTILSDAAAVELIAAGEADVTGTSVNAAIVPEIVRADPLRLLVEQSTAFYHVGYNTRRAPLSNPRFRRVVARLLDKESIVRDVFHGYAMPAASPLAMTRWLAPDLEWIDRDPVLQFIGTDGRLDEDRARRAFERAGYRYSDDGKLLGR